MRIKPIQFITLLLLMVFPVSTLAADVEFYDTDNVGSPVAMWDTNGKKVWEGEYFPFGEEYKVTESPVANKKHFVGKEKDNETGLTYFGARYMDETSGRFTSPDPVRPVDAFTSKTNYDILTNPQRLNRYAYGLNNPYRYVDPDGNWPDEIKETIVVKFDHNTGLPYFSREVSGQYDVQDDFGSLGSGKKAGTEGTTSRSARREVMREQGIPTTQQPLSQSQNMSGKSYEYEVPKSGGGTQIKSVQQQTMDVSHPNQGHWEAGSVKTDPISGQVRMNKYGRPKLTNDKSKKDYHD
jgi:RHS repeat-associated protein